MCSSWANPPGESTATLVPNHARPSLSGTYREDEASRRQECLPYCAKSCLCGNYSAVLTSFTAAGDRGNQQFFWEVGSRPVAYVALAACYATLARVQAH